MSEICIGILELGLPEDKLSFIKNEMEMCCRSGRLGLFWETVYREAFITEKMCDENAVFELRNSPEDMTCERLLCPDWCKYNEKENEEPLMERLRRIQRMIEVIMRNGCWVDLYIGDSGGDIEDYADYSLTCSDFSEKLIALYNEYGTTPYAHFRIIG